MKKLALLLLTLSLTMTSEAYAGVCRSGDAATQGAQVAFTRDTQAANTMVTNERNASNVLGTCITGITSVATAPMFLSLADIFNQIKNQICQIASSQINSQLSVVNGQISSAMSGITSQVNSTVNTSTGVSQIPGVNNINVVNSSGSTSLQQGSTSSSYYSNLWR